MGAIKSGADARAIILDCDDPVTAVKTIYNCHEADVDVTGDVWIKGPQRGHWLDDAALVRLAKRLVN